MLPGNWNLHMGVFGFAEFYIGRSYFMGIFENESPVLS